MLERSRAIKSPSIQYHLSGTKKIQQELARHGVLERFISDPDTASRIRQMFAGQHALDLGAEGDRAIELAIKSPHKFVLKPQREGGGVCENPLFLFNLLFTYHCLTPNSRCNFHAGVSLNIRSFINSFLLYIIL